MYKQQQRKPTSLNVDNSYKGESIEKKINRILNNKEPIKDGAPQIFTERREGVKPEYDIRTDRFELAVDAMDTVNKTKLAKRDDRLKTEDLENLARQGKTRDQGGKIIDMPKKGETGGQSTQGTENK